MSVPSQHSFCKRKTQHIDSIKKAASTTEKKDPSPPTAKLNSQNTPHAQSPLFQRLRAAPAGAKPPVNFVLDRQGRKEEKASKERKKIVKTRKATINTEMLKKTCKTQQSIQKTPINAEMLKNANRRQKQPDKAQKPPHTTNAKPATARQR